MNISREIFASYLWKSSTHYECSINTLKVINYMIFRHKYNQRYVKLKCIGVRFKRNSVLVLLNKTTRNLPESSSLTNQETRRAKQIIYGRFISQTCILKLLNKVLMGKTKTSTDSCNTLQFLADLVLPLGFRFRSSQLLLQSSHRAAVAATEFSSLQETRANFIAAPHL